MSSLLPSSRRLGRAVLPIVSVLALAALAPPAFAAPAFPTGAAATPGTLPPLVRRQIAVTDPTYGRLTFDALAAGDPALAAQGRLVLFLHGFPASPESFRAIMPAIAAAGYYAVAPWQMGYSLGASPKALGAYKIETIAPDTVRMADALGARHFHLVGHDWGGGVAWTVAARAPDWVESLTVLSTPHPDAMKEAVDTPGSGQTKQFGYLKLVRIPGIEYLMLSGGPTIFAKTLEAMGLTTGYARTYAWGVRNPRRLNRALAWYHANPIPAPFAVGSVAAPTTFVWGSKDFAFSRTAAEDSAHYVTGPYRFVALQGMDHWVPEKATEEVTQLVLERLASAPSAG